MEYKKDVKAGNNAGNDINNIARKYVDYYDIASISLTIKVGNINTGSYYEELVQGVNNVPKAYKYYSRTACTLYI